ncbi:MAG: glutamate--tRNA ligase [Clostridia bacterium]|nr:glutamate--tRNA ligase [Clostridia bacterium]
MDYEKLAELLYPQINKTPDYWEQKYPKRNLKEGAEVTRYAPSPTGYVHFGALFTALINKKVASESSGVYFLRIEDTDKKREVKNGANFIINGLKTFDLTFDESVVAGGEYGPYVQSERIEIYQTYAKDLVRKGLAYPCFCTHEEIDAIRSEQEKNKINMGYYGKYAKCRNLSYEEIESNIKQGKSFVLRFKCPYTAEQKVKTYDYVRGEREIPQNENDAVIIKSNGLPPYNFAHAIDDHLMGTTFVIRGDEWLPSFAEHLQLFEALGFKAPKYAHISPIQKLDNGNRRKISKRKDPEADVEFFYKKGYPIESLTEYLLTLANSNFETWRLQNPKADVNEFKFSIKNLSPSGSLFDMIKLNDISKNVISNFTAKQVFDNCLTWAEKYDEKFASLLKENKDYCINIFNIDREIAKPRKDISHWEEVLPTYSYMFDEFYNAGEVVFPEQFNKEDVKAVLSKYGDIYNEADEQSEWFDRIKDLAEQIGFAREVKMFKQNPEQFRGHCGDVSTIIRIALTGRTQTPNLYDICKLLGKNKIKERFENILKVF